MKFWVLLMIEGCKFDELIVLIYDEIGIDVNFGVLIVKLFDNLE